MAISNFTRSNQVAAPLDGVLRHADVSPGKLVRIDGSAARTAGATVITGQHLLDLDPYIGPIVRDQPLLAIDRIRYTGEPVAIVLAASAEAARAAAALVTIEVESLPPGVTGAPSGSDRLIHLTELLRPGPLADGVALDHDRTNRLVAATVESDANGHTPGQTIEITSTEQSPNERLIASAQFDGTSLRIASAIADVAYSGTILGALFEGTGIAVEIGPGVSTTRAAVHVDALAGVAARFVRGPVQITAETRAYGWSGPRGTIALSDSGASLVIDTGASAGEVPGWLTELGACLAETFGRTAVSVAVDYSESPPIVSDIDAWRSAISSAR